MQQPTLSIVHEQEPQTATSSSGTPPTDKGVRARPKLSYVLPNARMSIEKQLSLIRGYAVGSKFGQEPVDYQAAARLAQMHPNNATMCNAFLYDTGVARKVDGGVMPSDAAVAFARAYEWDPTAAPRKLREVFSQAWFAKVLESHLNMRPLAEAEAVRILAEKSGASPEHEKQLRMCIELLKIAGVLEGANGALRVAQGGSDTTGAAREPLINASIPESACESDSDAQAPSVARKPIPTNRASTPTQSMGMSGGIQFEFSVSLTAEDIAQLEPKQLSSLFEGLGKILAVKNGMMK